MVIIIYFQAQHFHLHAFYGSVRCGLVVAE